MGLRTEDIEIGKTYRIRQWDDMRGEYGIFPDDLYGETIPINKSVLFIEGMRYLCGKDFTVARVSQDFDSDNYYRLESCEEIEFANGESWIITPEMLEEIKTDNISPFTTSELKSLLGL